MYIKLAKLIITGDDEIIDGYFLLFYLFTLSLMNMEDGKIVEIILNRKNQQVLPPSTLFQAHSHSSLFKGKLLDRSFTDLWGKDVLHNYIMAFSQRNIKGNTGLKQFPQQVDFNFKLSIFSLSWLLL